MDLKNVTVIIAVVWFDLATSKARHYKYACTHCNTDDECPGGVCRTPEVGNVNKKKCFQCMCKEKHQCYLDEEDMLCNCTGSSFYGEFCKTDICQENPSVLIPDPLNCARYYDCSDAGIQQGLGVPYLRECDYPRLFGYGATDCQIFTEIQCDKRYEPKAPCEYVENQCFSATCEPCEQNNPSCVGKQDGSNIFPGREGTEYYIVCYKDRTVAILTCATGYYNHAKRYCE